MKKSLTMSVVAALLLVASLAVARAQKELRKDQFKEKYELANLEYSWARSEKI